MNGLCRALFACPLSYYQAIIREEYDMNTAQTGH